MLSKVIFVSLCAFVLAGCTAKTTTLVKPQLVDRPELIVPQTQPVTQSDIKWIVLTADNYDSKMKQLGSPTLFAVNAQGYRNLSVNVAELRKYIQQQNAVIEAYKTYYKNEQPQKK